MSMHLFEQSHPNVPDRPQLRLLCSYENGSVTLWAFRRMDKFTSVEGVGWDALWSSKLHVESGMSSRFAYESNGDILGADNVHCPGC